VGGLTETSLVSARETSYSRPVATSVRALVRNAVFDRVPGLLRRGPPSPRRVALTFDDGPDHMTGQYLDLLDRLGVPATFFVVGASVVARPETVREYLRRGHQLASHGFDHTRFTKLSRRALLDQCERTEQALGGQLSGRPWVRPPHGSIDLGSTLTLLATGYTVAMWTLDPCDYSDHDAASLAAKCAPEHVSPGEVLLFHEGQQWTLDAITPIVKALQADGYELVTMHDLFAT
jgi:peptidoglycan/xylan/chitin deacetylase (PgdA/CDA1 family)